MQKTTTAVLSIILAASILGGFISVPAAQASVIKQMILKALQAQTATAPTASGPKSDWPPMPPLPPFPGLPPQLGDVDMSGKITAGDARLVLYHISGKKYLSIGQQSLADVNRDGQINKADSDLILQYSIGKITEWPTLQNNLGVSIYVQSTATTPATSTSLLGDVNNNGKIDIGDALFIAQYAAGKRQFTAAQITIADVNRDGRATTEDAQMIAQYLVGKIKQFPTGALTLSAAVSTPSAQSVIGGISNFTLANFVFDASQSTEDIRVSSIKLTLQGTDATDVTNISLFDGQNKLNTGANILSTATLGAQTITLDNSLVIQRGVIKTIALKGDISASAAGGDYQQWGITSATATGVSTANFVQSKTAGLTDGSKITIINLP